MIDILLVGLTVLFFALAAGLYPRLRQTVTGAGIARVKENSVEYTIIGLFALALLAYLMYALLRPERF